MKRKTETMKTGAKVLIFIANGIVCRAGKLYGGRSRKCVFRLPKYFFNRLRDMGI